MKIRSSAVLLLPLTVSGEEFYNNNNSNSYSNNNINNYSNSNGNTYSNTNTYSNSNTEDSYGGLSMAEQAIDLMEMMFGQCLNNLDMDMDKLMDDPFADIKNRCTDQQATTFNSALNTFETCAGFDLKSLIEEFGSMYIGLFMNCGSYVMDMAEEIEEMPFQNQEYLENLKTKESPIPRVPQECVEALVGNNPFGQAFLYVEEFPVREQKCFSELAGKLPMCALSEWPVPIVGSWLSAISCIYGNAQDVLMPLMRDSLTSEFKLLNDCIPDTISASDCKAVRNKCIFDSDDPAMTVVLPPPFSAPPMSQFQKDIAAEEPHFGGLMDKYEAYRQTCIPAADLAIWDIVASHKENSDVKQGGASLFMEPSSPLVRSAASNSSSSTKFMPGLLTGMIVAFAAMFGYNKYRNDNVQVPPGYQFNSLELS